MKLIRGVLVIAVGFVLLVNVLHSQPTASSRFNSDSLTDLQTLLEALTSVPPTPYANLPKPGNSVGYWSMQNPLWPPLPGDILGLDFWSLGDGIFVLDDRKVDYNELDAEAQMEAAATLNFSSIMMSFAGNYAYGNPVYLTNLVVTTAPMTANFDIAGGTNNVPYDILTTTNLLNKISDWTWLGIGYTSNRYTFTSQPTNMAFYVLAKPAKTMTVGFGADGVAQCDVPYGLTNALQIAAGEGQSVALKNDGTVVAWGKNDYGQATVPTNLVGVAMIAAGWDYSVALLTNGTVTTWGDNLFGQRNVPSNLTNVTVISAQAQHTLALRKDGTVVSWGYNSVWGETNVPVGLSNVVAIAAGLGHNLAVSNGFVVAWGYNGYGQCNVPAGLSNVVDVAAGLYHSLALLNNGTVKAWGGNDHGETNVPAGLTNVVAIAASGDLYTGENSAYSLALKSDGTVVAWGDGEVLNPVGGLTDVIAIAAGERHALVVRTGPPTPVVTLGPIDEYQVQGSNVTFTVRGAGLYGVTYQWQTNGVNFTGATNTTLTLTNVQAAQQGNYRVIVNDNGGYGSIASSNASLTLVPPPVFIYQSQPTNLVTIYGKHPFFNGTATAPGMTNDFPISYHWQFNGTNILGATTSAYDFIVNDNSSGIYSLVAQNAAGSAIVNWQVTVTNAINVTNDLLLIYNTNSQDSTTILSYYLAHRPNVAGANVLGIGCTTNETISPVEFTNSFIPQIQNWLAINSSKRPQYVILFPAVPSRINTNTSEGNYDSLEVRPSVQNEIHVKSLDGWSPFVTAINMNGFGGTNDCVAYINKLANIGVIIASNSPILSASAGGYGNTNFILDNVRHGAGTGDGNYTGLGFLITDAIPAITNSNPNVAINYIDGVETNTQSLPHITNAVNVAGYICWGQHSNWGTNLWDGYYSTNGAVRFASNSAWWIIRTKESFNGQRYVAFQGNPLKWYASYAFGGTNYSCTPIGAVGYTDEPGAAGTDNAKYFGLWAAGKNFGICAWDSKNTSFFQAIGDPFVTR